MAFQGDKKFGKSILYDIEIPFRDWLVPKVPRWLEGYHLTLTTILWSILIVVFSFLAKHNIHWLWLVSLMIFLQYITDLLDGAVGRARDTGLVKWGYYMDHFLDYIFLSSILIGYALLLPDVFKYRLFFVMAFFGAFMVNSFLSFAATNKFKIAYMGIGPTEIRIVFIIINTLLICFGRTYMLKALPFVLCAATFGLFVTVYRTQKMLWDIDMRAKYGEGNTTADNLPKTSEIVHDITGGISKRKIFRNILLSLCIAAVAVVFLTMKIAYPHHRVIAIILYLLSWVPFLLSFRDSRESIKSHRRNIRNKLRPVTLHVVMAIILIVVGRSAWVLVPPEMGYPSELTDGELRASVNRDEQSFHILGVNVHRVITSDYSRELLAKPVTSMSEDERTAVRALWRDFVEACMELEILKRRYRGFYHIDYLVKPTLHADAFFIAYGAFVTQYEASLLMSDQIEKNKFLNNVLNEAMPEYEIPADSYADMVSRMMHADELLRLNAGFAYLKLVDKKVSDNFELLPVVETKVKRIYRQLGKNPKNLVDSPLDLLERTAFMAWFPFQKEVAIQMSHLRGTDRRMFIDPYLVSQHIDKLHPGDILLERRNWFMTNAGIPGFWPHAVLFVGTLERFDEYFEGVEGTGGRKPSEVVAERYPNAYEDWLKPERGFKRSVIEARREGVILNSLENSADCDYLGAMRPRISREDKFKAILAAMSHAGKPYDYNFDFSTDASLVCSELVYKSYNEVKGLSFDFEIVNGRPLLPPNHIARKFDREYGTPDQQLDFVLFLDGSEENQNAVPRDVAHFRDTWRRPKWEVLLD